MASPSTNNITMMKIATWNLCLGLTNKKDYVYKTLNEEKIDICLLQEVEIENDYPIQLLTSRNFKIEVEKNTKKARSAIAIRDNIEYKRRLDLEEIDSGLVVIDINSTRNYRIINLYRQFAPRNNLTQTEHFSLQLRNIELLLQNLNGRKIIIAGDFNLDDLKRYSHSYTNKNLFEILNSTFDDLNLYQLVEFPTWQRIVNNVKKESILDHIYVQDPTIIENITHKIPLIGDHKLIMFEIVFMPEKITPTLKRNWHHYSKNKLLNLLSNTDLNFEADQVQAYWNKFEQTINPIVDKLAPLEPFFNNCSSKSQKPSPSIKRKINLRKRLLRSMENNFSNELRNRIKNLNVEIKNHFNSKKTCSVRRKIIPGNSKSLWDAVKLAKDVNNPKIPNHMLSNNIEIP